MRGVITGQAQHTVRMQRDAFDDESIRRAWVTRHNQLTRLRQTPGICRRIDEQPIAVSQRWLHAVARYRHAVLPRPK